MRKHFTMLTKVALFKDIAAAELDTMLKCLNADIKTADEGEFVLLSGDKPEYVGVLLSGKLHIIREDYDGGRMIMAAISQGGIFGESLCCAGIAESPVTVQADTDSTILLLRFSRILHTCPNSCAFHTKLIENMLKLVANKNLMLQDRMEIVSQKSVRAKVTRYLASFAPEREQEFIIPFNREELADYLCVERSALSHELAKMKRDGLIDYRKNRFIVY